MGNYFQQHSGQLLQNAGNGMFQVVQPMQTVTVDGQEALFIPNMNSATANASNQLNGAQPIQIGGHQAFLTPNGQIIRAPGVLPANFNMGQTVQLPTGKLIIKIWIKKKTLLYTQILLWIAWYTEWGNNQNNSYNFNFYFWVCEIR